MFQIIFEDEHFIAIDKPPGHYVHPPENSQYKVAKELICLYTLRDYLGAYIYPIHRLDCPTGGVVLFGKTSEASGLVQKQWQSHSVEKKYLTVIRGHSKLEGLIESPLRSDSSDQLLPSLTKFTCLAQIELPHPVGKRHPTARYSLLDVVPHTGRYHQIRRHLASISHPVVGDIKHGDSHHNRFVRTQLEIPGLLLHSYKLKIMHPYSQQELQLTTPWSERWRKVFSLFNNPPLPI